VNNRSPTTKTVPQNFQNHRRIKSPATCRATQNAKNENVACNLAQMEEEEEKNRRQEKKEKDRKLLQY
jgi:hypothetical protein